MSDLTIRPFMSGNGGTSGNAITSDSAVLSGTLAPEERRRISVRLGAGLVGVGLLALGTLLTRLSPDQWQIGELCRALAAAVVGIPTLISGLGGIVKGDTRRATDQLVAIAILAAAASGDFVTATLIPLFSNWGASSKSEVLLALGRP